MKKFKTLLKRAIFAGYLGGSLVWFIDLHSDDWRFYAIIMPTIIFVSIFNDPPHE